MKNNFPEQKFVAMILAILLLFSSSCELEKNYSTSDLNGIWTGNMRVIFHGGDYNGLDTIISKSFTFNASGNLQSISEHPGFLSNTGSLSVNNNGTIEGVITTTHDTNPGIETTLENWTGCFFETKTEMSVNMRWDWTNTRPGTGYYLITGKLTKQ